MLNELPRTKFLLPINARGYISLRDVGLNERAWDTEEIWTKGNYDLNEVATALRNLQRPVPGKGDGHVTGLNAYVEDDNMSQVTSASFLFHPSGGETAVSLTYMTETFFPAREL